MGLSNLELEQIIDEKLNSKVINDYAPNGLQVEGKAQIQRIITGVTATLPLIEKAIENLELSVSGSMNLFDYSPDEYDDDLDEDDFGEDVDDLEDDDEEYLDEEIGDMDDDE